MRVRTLILIAVGAVVALGGGIAIGTAIDDPEVAVSPVVIPDVSPASGSDPVAITGSDRTADPMETARPSTVQTVVGLERLVGPLRPGDDPHDWYVAGVEVNFGPDGWISGAPAIADFDGDGSVEPLLKELRGLRDREVTLGVRFETDRDEADAYTIQGLEFRDPTGGAAPWQTAPAGLRASRDEVAAAALGAAGPGSLLIDIDREFDDGWSGWDVEVRGPDGRAFQLYLDLTGAVLEIRPEED
jgi:hypothetical protein